MTKQKYDLVFSLGEACSCAQTLINTDLRQFSGPFDWLFGSDFVGRCKILASNFDRFIEKGDLEDTGKTNLDTHNLCEIYYNKYNDIAFNHDFLKSLSFDDVYTQVKEKYDRRINRLLAQIESASKILIVYIETPNTEKHTSDKDIIAGLDIIHQKYPNKQVDLLYFKSDSQMQLNQFKKEALSENITKITSNYKSQKPNAMPYDVNLRFLARLLSEYRLNLPFIKRFKKVSLRCVINCIPIKSIRKNLRRKHHV